ncbi:hypothetical protein ACM70V_14935 [Pseudomonas aeruginosa]
MSTFFQEYTKYTSELIARADQLEHERDLLGQALGECIEAAGVTTPGVALTGPQLLLFAEDLKAHIGGLRGQLADTAVPMQPLVKDDHGVARFKANKIVNHLLDYASERGCGMTELAKLQFPDEDYMQFAQLIGYSVSGYSDLSYVSDDSRGLAYAKLDLLTSAPDVADAQVERPEVVETAVLILEAAGWRNDDPKASVTSVSELLSCIVGTLRAANAKLKKELAMARDAASKGDAARHAAGGMEMEIQELREKVTELKKELRSRWTYASTQATNCAGCGAHKHTPLRVDWMGGYVCLTCIDEKLEELHGAQVQHSVLEGWKLVPEDATLEMVEALKAELVTTSKGGILRAGIALNAAIAAAPASTEES